MISVRVLAEAPALKVAVLPFPEVSPPGPKMLNSAIVQALEAATTLSPLAVKALVPVDMVTLSPVEVAMPVRVQLPMLVIGWLGTDTALALFFQQEVPRMATWFQPWPAGQFAL